MSVARFMETLATVFLRQPSLAPTLERLAAELPAVASTPRLSLLPNPAQFPVMTTASLHPAPPTSPTMAAPLEVLVWALPASPPGPTPRSSIPAPSVARLESRPGNLPMSQTAAIFRAPAPFGISAGTNAIVVNSGSITGSETGIHAGGTASNQFNAGTIQ